MSEQATTTAPKNIFEALVQVRAACPYVRKDREMTSGAVYNYASIDAYLAELKPQLDKAGICLYPVGSELISKTEVEVGHKKTRMFLAVVRVRYMVTHAATESSLPMPIEVMGEATDTLDKSIPKAYTMTLKQLFRQLFQVETGEEERASPEQSLSPRENPMLQKALSAVRECEDQAKFDSIVSYAKKNGFSDDEISQLRAAWAAKSKAKQNGHKQAEAVEF